MKPELFLGITTTLIGILIGFAGNYLIAKFNARNELKKSVAAYRADYYIALWQLCDRKLETKEQQQNRFIEINKWYDEGGGLLLPFKATDRLIGAKNILEQSLKQDLGAQELLTLQQNLSWLRTEMKFEVGSYSRKEANSILPNIKNNN